MVVEGYAPGHGGIERASPVVEGFEAFDHALKIFAI